MLSSDDYLFFIDTNKGIQHMTLKRTGIVDSVFVFLSDIEILKCILIETR